MESGIYGVKPALLLIVDDDDMMRTALAMALSTRGFRVVERTCGETALQYLRHGERPELILLDLVMPNMDGWEFRNAQLRDESLASIPVVAMSADRSPRAHAVSVEAFIAKPVTPPLLLTTIGRILEHACATGPASGAITPGRAWRAARVRRTHVIERNTRCAQRMQAHATRLVRSRRQSGRGVLVARRLLALSELRCERRLALISNGLSHIINNALQCFMACAETMIDATPEDAALRELALRSVDQCAVVLARLAVGAQLSVAAADSQRLGLAASNMEERWRALCPRGVELRVTHMEALASARVSAESLNAIMAELIANSVEAMKGTGVLEVRAGIGSFQAHELAFALPLKNIRSDCFCYLDVIDDGPGIHADLLPQIFEPFFSTRFAGRGLGLSSVLGRIAASGGLVLAKSTFGLGTTIRLLFPACQ